MYTAPEPTYITYQTTLASFVAFINSNCILTIIITSGYTGLELG